MSNLGTTAILNIAGPILNVIFPVFIMLVILSFLPKRINQETYSAPYGALCAFIVTVLTEIGGFVPSLKLFMTRLPLASVGLGWLIPSLIAATIGAFVGAFVPRKHRSFHKQKK